MWAVRSSAVTIYSMYLRLNLSTKPDFKFAGSNPAEAVGFFRAKTSSARLLSEGK